MWMSFLLPLFRLASNTVLLRCFESRYVQKPVTVLVADSFDCHDDGVYGTRILVATLCPTDKYAAGDCVASTAVGAG